MAWARQAAALGTAAGGADQYHGSVPPGTASSVPDAPAASSDEGRERRRAAGPPIPPAGDTWIDLSTAPLAGAPVGAWATTEDSGAVVTFSGTVRDHAPGREGVTSLTYEAYEAAAVARMGAVVDDVRERWPEVRRVAALHRTGRLEVGDVAVVVAVSAPHRGAAFAAAAHCIDTLKATVPLWKKETWTGGEEWGTDAVPISEPGAEPRP